MAFIPSELDPEPRTDFPSNGITSLLTLSLIKSVHLINAVLNAFGEISINTRLKVSCEGIPFGSDKNF